MGYINPTNSASGTTFGQFAVGGATLVLENWITAQAAVYTPAVAPTISVNGGGTSGGSLAAGTYYLKETQYGGFGETAPGPESASFTVSQQANAVTAITVSVGSATTGALAAGGYKATYTYVDSTNGGQTLPSTESAVFTVALGNTPTLTFPPGLPSFANGRDVYLTPPNGTTNTEVLYATGVTTNTLVISNSLYVNNTTTYANATAQPTVNTTTTNIPQVTFTSLTSSNGLAHNVYLTAAGGNTGTETRYADGITASTYNLSAAAPTTSFAVNPPYSNETGFTFQSAAGPTINEMLVFLRAAEYGNLQDVYRKGRTVVEEFIAGKPMDHRGAVSRVERVQATFQALAQVFGECAVLMENNPGHIRATGAISVPGGLTRQWP